ncbi:PREDICTED: serine/arginine repetitive matrix protein 1-like [Camelina sativa]|uniref:Serine/arginine repetitive matrix protein 1-like n=1 Tax=Camelina sativa TaxID=90675 RepID=A0ABM1RES7_CAMSA|nr:PREDICTED: serine/arginine repetitive matrix protein 1-like [Camelina sativa]
MIPFWIELQGLPKHYWKVEMIQTIGEILGELLDWEITNSAIQLKALINGLDPITKETVVEFADGSESRYPGLQTRESTPSGAGGQAIDLQAHRSISRNYYTPQDNFLPPRNQQHSSGRSALPRPYSNPRNRQFTSIEERERSFSANRDYHLKRKDPEVEKRLSHQRRTPSRQVETPSQGVRGSILLSVSHRHLPQPVRNLQWREKPTTSIDDHGDPSVSSRARRPPLERNVSSPDPNTPPPRQDGLSSSLPPPKVTTPLASPRRAQVLEDLREVTVQYISCPDPSESAALRMRVMQSEAEKLMEKTADSIIAYQNTMEENPPLNLVPVSDTPLSPCLTNPDLPILGRSTSSSNKRGRGRPPAHKQAPKQNQKLLGAKSQKENFAQGSPRKTTATRVVEKPGPSKTTHKKGSKSSPKGKTQASRSQNSTPDQNRSSHHNLSTSQQPSSSGAPLISLIPAIKRKNADFQNPPTPIP